MQCSKSVRNATYGELKVPKAQECTRGHGDGFKLSPAVLLGEPDAFAFAIEDADRLIVNIFPVIPSKQRQPLRSHRTAIRDLRAEVAWEVDLHATVECGLGVLVQLLPYPGSVRRRSVDEDVDILEVLRLGLGRDELGAFGLERLGLLRRWVTSQDHDAGDLLGKELGRQKCFRDVTTWMTWW